MVQILATIALTIILIVAVTDLIATLASVGLLNDMREQISKYTTTTPAQESDDYQRGYNQGVENTNITLHLALYDMYTKDEILDFDAHIEEVTGRMVELVTDAQRFTIVSEKFEEYITGKEDTYGPNDY